MKCWSRETGEPESLARFLNLVVRQSLALRGDLGGESPVVRGRGFIPDSCCCSVHALLRRPKVFFRVSIQSGLPLPYCAMPVKICPFGVSGGQGTRRKLNSFVEMAQRLTRSVTHAKESDGKLIFSGEPVLIRAV